MNEGVKFRPPSQYFCYLGARMYVNPNARESVRTIYCCVMIWVPFWFCYPVLGVHPGASWTATRSAFFSLRVRVPARVSGLVHGNAVKLLPGFAYGRRGQGGNIRRFFECFVLPMLPI